jgi:Family of unknown function (DUF6535)
MATLQNSQPPGNIRPKEEDLIQMDKENSVWDVYNNEARKVDNELVKDWRDSLNSLLLFVGA